MSQVVELQIKFVDDPMRALNHLVWGVNPANPDEVGTCLYYNGVEERFEWNICSPYEDAPGIRKFFSSNMQLEMAKWYTVRATFDPAEDTGTIELDGVDITSGDSDAGMSYGGMAAISEVGHVEDLARMHVASCRFAGKSEDYTYSLIRESDVPPTDTLIPEDSGDGPDMEFDSARWVLTAPPAKEPDEPDEPDEDVVAGPKE